KKAIQVEIARIERMAVDFMGRNYSAAGDKGAWICRKVADKEKLTLQFAVKELFVATNIVVTHLMNCKARKPGKDNQNEHTGDTEGRSQHLERGSGPLHGRVQGKTHDDLQREGAILEDHRRFDA